MNKQCHVCEKKVITKCNIFIVSLNLFNIYSRFILRYSNEKYIYFPSSPKQILNNFNIFAKQY